MERTFESLPHAAIRRLLRRLRDLNLASRVAVRPGAFVRLKGCSSVDAPVESGVRYQLLDDQGHLSTLELTAGDGTVELRLADAYGERRIAAPCVHDGAGHGSLPTLAARWPVESTDPRAYARVLRRVVRGFYAA